MEEKRPLRIVVVMFSSICIIAIGLFFCSLIGKLFPVDTVDQKFVRVIVPRVIMAVVCIIGMKLVYKDLKLGFQKKGLVKGLCISFVMILYIIENFISASNTDSVKNYAQITFVNLLLCFLSNMSVGLFEEVLLRGTVLNIMNEQWKSRKYGTYWAVFLSSFLFGVAHFINYFNGKAYMNPTIAQVFYATFIGLFMAAVYLRSKNIWVVIILHGLFDFAPGFWELTTPTKEFDKVDMSLGSVRYLILFYLPLAIAAYFITRSHVKESRLGQ